MSPARGSRGSLSEPNEWQAITAADGSTYYYNPATGETSWTREGRRGSGMITSAFV